MKLSIIGTGYVGFTTGVCFAELGHNVICVDNNLEKLDKFNKGESPIFEPGIEEMLKRNLENGRLSFISEIPPAVKESEIIFICVNTPPKEDGHVDLKYIERAAREIALSINDEYKLIVDKSTVPVKTAEKVRETILRYCASGAKFDVVSNPEFLREGTAIKDVLEPDRIIIGADNEHAKEMMIELYKPLTDKINVPVKFVNVRSAELIKHGANTFLAAKISFANLMAYVCEEAKADALEVLDAIGLDVRIGKQFLNPGIGFGGSCFPKDISAFENTLNVLGIDMSLIKAIQQINELAWQRFLKKVEKELWVLDGKVIGVLGLAFKPNTDDIRNSPALKIIEELKANGAKVKAYDPQAVEKTKKAIPDVQYCLDAYEVAQGSEALLICTEWDEFKALDLERIKNSMVTPIIFDGRNIFEPSRMREIGFKYFGVGR